MIGVIATASGILCALIAGRRGRRRWLWFLLGFFLSPLMVIVVMLRRRVNQPVPVYGDIPSSSDDRSPYDLETSAGLPVNTLSDTRDCPRCAETIKRAALVCRFCGANLEAESSGACGAMVGDSVVHPAIGNGIIVRIEAGGVALVQFEKEESRILLRHLIPMESVTADPGGEPSERSPANA